MVKTIRWNLTSTAFDAGHYGLNDSGRAHASAQLHRGSLGR
jgi:hypothetical protein